jgi:hypothetical protein
MATKVSNSLIESSAGIAKAWVNFSGIGGIRASYNVTSVARNATGKFTVYFTTPMTDINYSITGMCGSGTDTPYFNSTAAYMNAPQGTLTLSSFNLGTGQGAVSGANGTRSDVNYNYIQVFGN